MLEQAMHFLPSTPSALRVFSTLELTFVLVSHTPTPPNPAYHWSGLPTHSQHRPQDFEGTYLAPHNTLHSLLTMLSSGAKAGVFATLGWTPGHSILTLATSSLLPATGPP